MCDSEAEKILFILNKHERAYRRLIPVYIFLAIVLWILPILLIIYLYFCIVDNEFLRIGFCIAWTAYYFLSLLNGKKALDILIKCFPSLYVRK